MDKTKSQNSAEKRKYLRLSSVFPVEYAFCELADKNFLEWQQGFTFNISSGGIGLSLNKIDPLLESQLHSGNLKMDVKIRVPLNRPPVCARARVAWVEEHLDQNPAKYLIGLEFVSITPQDTSKLLFHARWVRFSLWAVSTVALVLAAAFLSSMLYNFSLRASNRSLVNDLVRIQREETQAARDRRDITVEKKVLSEKLGGYDQSVVRLRKELQEAQVQLKQQSDLTQQIGGYQDKIQNLTTQIEQLMSERQPLDNRLETLVNREAMVADQLALLERKKEGLQRTVLNKMYSWLKNHQNPATGLVLSFEGEVDIIRYWSFIYDQALAVNAFLLFNDINDARKVLSFFSRNAQEPFSGFHNAYYVDSGEISEYTIHSGPNIWVGIAALQFMDKTGDSSFLPLARTIGDWLISVQDADPAGGIKGGPEVSWFATEHNLDAYAFFGMLAQVTGEEKYKTAQAKVASWLKNFSMTPHADDYKSPPLKRGRGDATIATDTFAWALAAMGPEKLIEMGMDPEEVMRFAQEHCAVTVKYQRPSGTTLEVSGFDFSKVEHLPRGGMISPEWTSQMIVSYQMLGKYFFKRNDPVKAAYYQEKAQFYLDELNKLIISSPSKMGQGEGCLPYATLEDADTGHGWRTPRGASTGSIAGTAYMMMAIKEFNPLMLKEK